MDVKLDPSVIPCICWTDCTTCSFVNNDQYQLSNAIIYIIENIKQVVFPSNTINIITLLLLLVHWTSNL